MSQGTKKSVADHLRSILGRLAKLENRVQSLEERDSGTAVADASGVPPLDREVLAQVVELENRLKQVEEENKELSETCALLREQHEAISNLYVAKHRLHASLDSAEIMNIVTEILNELVGAEEFAILFLEQKKKILKRVAGRGASDFSDAVPLGEGLLGKVASDGSPFYFETNGNEERPDNVPLAVIPLKAEEKSVGVIAVYRLLAHKEGLTPVDHQLLELVAEHAPSALLSARLHRLSKKNRGA